MQPIHILHTELVSSITYTSYLGCQWWDVVWVGKKSAMPRRYGFYTAIIRPPAYDADNSLCLTVSYHVSNKGKTITMFWKYERRTENGSVKWFIITRKEAWV
jgi:hypothetical protein